MKPTKQPGRDAEDGIPIDASDAPDEGSDAGDAHELHRERRLGRIRSYRSAANREFAAAKAALNESPSGAEDHARAAIDATVRAFWWAEGTELEDPLHQQMHRIGKWTRQNFGCHLDFDGTRYQQSCPIEIAHKRFGFSIAFTAQRICSICGDDLSECPHLRDRSYWARGGRGPSGHCPVCMREEICGHEPDRLFRVPVVSIIRKMEGREISLVGRPAEPEARILAVPVDTDDLAEALGPEFNAGMPVSCDKCLGPCAGFTELPKSEEPRYLEPPNQDATLTP